MIDVDGDALTFTITTPPQYGTVALEADGWFTYTPDPVARGIGGGYDYFWYSATDGESALDGLWQFWVADPPPAPPAPPVMVIVGYQDSPLYGELDFLDAEADDLAVSLAARAAHGKVSVFADGSFRYRPRRGYVGTDSFIVRSNDGTGWVESTVGLMVKAGLPWAAPNREFAFYESQETYHQSDYYTHAIYEGDYTPDITYAGVMVVLADGATADDLSAPVLPADLIVMGTRDADSIRVSRASRGRVRVWLNDTPLGTFAVSGDVRVYALTGDDRVQLSGGQFGTEVYGGRGNDTLVGSTGADSLFGDDGDDTVWGRGGRDLLVGGLGADLLSGDGAGDLLIDSLVPGDLISEDLHAGEQGVFLLAAWNGPGTNEEKLAALSADAGPLSAAKRAGIYDEGDADVLVGGGDSDCVLASAVTDTFRDRATGDIFAPFAMAGPIPAA
jgi:hypothetical protein